MVKISASILSKRNLETINELNQLDIDYFHIDVMDGEFVSNVTFSLDELNKFEGSFQKPLDVHLMVNNPDNYFETLKRLNTEYVTIHYEILKDEMILNKIKDYGFKVGLSLNPQTSIESIYPYLNKIDLVLIMSVDPGYGGQPFLFNSLSRIKSLKEEINNQQVNVLVSIDGGINLINYQEINKYQPDFVVLGTSLVNSVQPKEFITKIREM
ncbi:MAG: ribulose-phosphate 3-epimerase [Bacilli bacterium]